MKNFVVILLLFIVTGARADKDFSWWNAIHNWDGHKDWEDYFRISTAYMGPNALPVPEVQKGVLDSTMEFELAGDAHFSKGDHTQDFFVRGYYPFRQQKVALSIDVIPVEWFKTDTVTRDLRASREREGKGKAGGDIYVATYVQLLKDRNHWPDFSLRIAMRTASGTDFSEARYTDGPGYFFDVSGGKSFSAGKSFLNSIRIYGMTGLYVYQTFDILHLQNDCFLYGGGIDFHFPHLTFSQELGGYNGYLDDGDHPLVSRSSLIVSLKKFDYKISFQHGIHDFPSDRLRASATFRF